MILYLFYSPPRAFTCPHTRGDDPFRQIFTFNKLILSPHAWGWSLQGIKIITLLLLVPTRVGMIPLVVLGMCNIRSCPHTRGDDPRKITADYGSLPLSPHAWGWSLGVHWVDTYSNLVPTRVGMIQNIWRQKGRKKTCPHTRGDDQKEN